MRVARVPVEQQFNTLISGTAQIITRADFAAKLKRAFELDRPLRVKLGADPSAPDIHIGHAVPLRKLRQFQDYGHEVYFVIGDFTGRIGDPSGKADARPQLTAAEVRANATTYETQIFKILLPHLTHVVFNNDWLSRLGFLDVVKLASSYTVARLLERDDFSRRFREGRPIHVHEFLYPLAQAYDSVHLEADVELGGTDQTFNFVASRDVMRHYGLEPQVAMTMPLLVGIDGQDKMSKSLGNYIAVADAPGEVYGRAMSAPDALLPQYLRLTTAWRNEEIDCLLASLAAGQNPRDVKMLLAKRLVELYHGAEAAERAESSFRRVFGQGLAPAEMPELELLESELEAGRIWVVRLLVRAGLAATSSEARRLLRQGAVRADGRLLTEQDEVAVPAELVLQVGRRRFVRVCRRPG